MQERLENRDCQSISLNDDSVFTDTFNNKEAHFLSTMEFDG